MRAIQTAVLSFGMSGWVFHAPFIESHPGFSFYGVWERTKNLAREKYPEVKVFRTLETLLADKSIELVVVNTPNATHYDYTRLSLLAGKHVIVEKPFTVNVKEGQELIALAKERGLLLSVYHNRRFDSDFRTIKRVLQSGALGQLSEAEFHYDRFRTELSPKVHKETPGAGTGSLYDLGAHLIDQALQLFGKPDALFADIQTLRPHSQVDDYFELLLYYPSFRIRLKCNNMVCEPLPAYTIHGISGTFIKQKTDVQETALQAGRKPEGADWGQEPVSEKGLLHTVNDGRHQKVHIESERGNYMDYYEGIYQALRNKGENPVPAEEALLVVHLIEKAFQSNREQKLVRLS